MGAVGSTAAVLLAVIFVWAAGAKLVGRRDVVDDIAAMGLPVPPVTLGAVIGAELNTAVLLVARPTVGAVVALLLLSGFSLFLLTIIRSGRQVHCGCFGANHREPISQVEIVRNAALGILALLALGGSWNAPISLPAVMVVSLVSVCLLVIVNLAALARTSGSLFRIELAGEMTDLAGPGGDAR